MTHRLLIALMALSITGCTVIKPVACGIAYPGMRIAADVRSADDDDEDDYKEMPMAVFIPCALVLIPIRYAHLTVASTVQGFFTGLVSDLNVITGNCNIDTTVENLLIPGYTNALPRAE